MVALPYQIKRLIFGRAVKAWLLALCMQLLQFALALLLGHFSALHPIQWVQHSLRLFFGFYNGALLIWLAVLLFYGIFSCHACLAEKKYHANRFLWTLRVGPQKFVLLCWQLIFGLFTAGIYASYLNENCSSLFGKCENKNCISSCNVFLYVAGVTGSLHYFIKNTLRQESHIAFPVLVERTYVQMRARISSTLRSCLISSLLPTSISALCFWLLGDVFVAQLGGIFGIGSDEQLSSVIAIATNMYLLLNALLIIWQIQCSLDLLRSFFEIFMTQPYNFVIEADVRLPEAERFTLAKALSLQQVPVVQHLAAKALFDLSHSKKAEARAAIFALSQPGNHPVNWKILTAQCLCLINNFTAQLSEALKNISTVKQLPLHAIVADSDENVAQKILLRRYNESNGIRSIISEQEEQSAYTSQTFSYKVKDKYDYVLHEVDQNIRVICWSFLRKLLTSIPGFVYFFVEADDGKTIFLLTHSQSLIWLTQALSALAETSLIEDKYGVVQCTLPQIVKALLNLKLELDKLKSVNLNRKKLDYNLLALKAAVKRSLYRICTAFGDYLKDLSIEPEDYRQLQCFLWFQDT